MSRRFGFEPEEEEFFHHENGPTLSMVFDVSKSEKRLAER
jgi:hypothetical protein